LLVVMRAVLHPEYTAGTREALVERLDLDWVFPEDEEGVIAALADGGPVLLTAKWNPAYLIPSLRWVQGLGAGYEQFPIADLEEAGIVFSHASGSHFCVAEHAFGLLLAMTRHIADAVRAGVGRNWTSPPLMTDLSGSTMAIVGLGYVGEEIARRAQGWGIRLIGVKRDPSRYQGVVEEVVGPDRLDEACHGADILMLVLPGFPDTRALIGARQLDLLGRGWLVNVGRGAVVDEEAMIERLADGRLAGAGLDVFGEEPLPVDSPLWTMPNVVITPHTAGESPGYTGLFAQLVADNLVAFQGGGPWRNRVC
jgi:D-2-hydroxyacid dehydrogenase (NADP+)